MSYCTIFRTKRGGSWSSGKTLHASACFASFYRNMFALDEVEVWVRKSYKGGYGGINTMKYSKEEVEEYVCLLKKCGFKFTFSEDTLNFYDKEELAYKFLIVTKENSSITNLILLNAIRYLYENPLNSFPEYFMKLCKNKGKHHPFNLFLIAHSAESGWGSGHSIVSSYTNPFHYHTIVERKKVFNNDEKVSGTSALMKMKSINAVDWQTLSKSVKEDTTANVVKLYKEIEEKYGKRE